MLAFLGQECSVGEVGGAVPGWAYRLSDLKGCHPDAEIASKLIDCHLKLAKGGICYLVVGQALRYVPYYRDSTMICCRPPGH